MVMVFGVVFGHATLEFLFRDDFAYVFYDVFTWRDKVRVRLKLMPSLSVGVSSVYDILYEILPINMNPRTIKIFPIIAFSCPLKGIPKFADTFSVTAPLI